MPQNSEMQKSYYNISFHIENSVFDRWEQWILTDGISQLLEWGNFQKAQILEVQTFDNEAKTYCVQLTTTPQKVKIFQEKYEAKFRHWVFKTFGESVLPFITELHLKEVIVNQQDTNNE